MLKKLLIFISLMFCCACASEGVFSSIGNDVVNPLTVAVDSTNNFAYIVNSNNKISAAWQEGSLHILDLTNLAASSTVARVGDSTVISSMSGGVYLDIASGYLYLTNRLSSGDDDITDTLYRIQLDVATGTVNAVETYDVSENPYGLGLDNASGNMFIATQGDALQYFDVNQTPSITELDLLPALSDGTALYQGEINRVAILGSWLFASRTRGGVYVINLDEISDTSAKPIDYFISDITEPRGIGTDGTYIYVIDAGADPGSVLILNPASLVPVTDNTTTAIKDKDDDGLLVASVAVGNDPHELVVGQSYVFVSDLEDDIVSFIDIASQTKVKDVAVGEEPFGMAVYSPDIDGDGDADDTHLFVCNIESNNVSIINIATQAVVVTYP